MWRRLSCLRVRATFQSPVGNTGLEGLLYEPCSWAQRSKFVLRIHPRTRPSATWIVPQNGDARPRSRKPLNQPGEPSRPTIEWGESRREGCGFRWQADARPAGPLGQHGNRSSHFPRSQDGGCLRLYNQGNVAKAVAAEESNSSAIRAPRHSVNRLVRRCVRHDLSSKPR